MLEPRQCEPARFLDHRPHVLALHLRLAPRDEVAQPPDDLAGAQRLLRRLIHDLPHRADLLAPVLRKQPARGVDGIGGRGQGLIELVRERGGHLPGRAQTRSMEQAPICMTCSRAFARSAPPDLRHQLVAGFRQLGSPLGHTPFQHVVEFAQLGLRPFLGSEIATDGGQVHRLAGARIVDPEPVDQKGYVLAGPEMTEIQLADPATRSHDDRPAFVPRAIAVVGGNKLEDVGARRFFHRAETQELQPGGVYVLRAAVQAGETDKVGGTFDHADKAPLVPLRLPPLQCNGRVVCADAEEKPLPLRRKIRLKRACNQNCITAKPDRGGCHAQLAVSQWVGDNRGLLGSFERCLAQGCAELCRQIPAESFFRRA